MATFGPAPGGGIFAISFARAVLQSAVVRKGADPAAACLADAAVACWVDSAGSDKGAGLCCGEDPCMLRADAPVGADSAGGPVTSSAGGPASPGGADSAGRGACGGCFTGGGPRGVDGLDVFALGDSAGGALTIMPPSVTGGAVARAFPHRLTAG